MEFVILNSGDKLSFCSNLHNYTVSFSKPSMNTASVSVEVCNSNITLSQVIAETTIQQVSFHYDELSNSHFIQFGTCVTISNFDWYHCQLIADFFGFVNHLTSNEAI